MAKQFQYVILLTPTTAQHNHLCVLLVYLCCHFCTHKPKDRHKQGPEEGWEGGQDAIGQTGHHKTRTSDR